MGLRIYERDLYSILEDINDLLPANDHVEVSCAYGGYKVEFCKGHRDLLSTGYITKKELYFRIAGYLTGLQQGLELGIKHV